MRADPDRSPRSSRSRPGTVTSPTSHTTETLREPLAASTDRSSDNPGHFEKAAFEPRAVGIGRVREGIGDVERRLNRIHAIACLTRDQTCGGRNTARVHGLELIGVLENA